jgi:phosphatidylserine decarboxylase
MLVSLKKCLYSLLPQHWLSRFAGVVSRCEAGWLRRPVIRWFIQHYGVEMSLAVEPNPEAYRSFNQFFIRPLKPSVRPICADARAMASPADGVISQMGRIHHGELLQAKGFSYSLLGLLGGDAALSKPFVSGEFMTIYLSPKDYHRVHMPLAGRLERMVYVPGRLFSVNAFSTTNIPNLFARNERVVCWFSTDFGPMVVVLVGAMLVASIHTVWQGQIAPKPSGEIVTLPYAERNIQLAKGAELGHFELGSTVIILFPKDVIRWQADLHNGSKVIVGQEIAIAEQPLNANHRNEFG